jgi:hypothetical protein
MEKVVCKCFICKKPIFRDDIRINKNIRFYSTGTKNVLVHEHHAGCSDLEIAKESDAKKYIINSKGKN